MIKIDDQDPAVKDFRALSAKLRELQIEQSNLGKQIDDKLQTLARMNQQAGHQITLAAQAMLSGDISLEAVNQANIEKELDSLRQRTPVVEKAIQLQRQIVDKARAQYSQKLNAQAQEQHDLNVLRIAKALREVAVCFDAENKLFEELRALDASVRLRPMRVNAVGSIHDSYSLPNLFLREIQEFFPAVFKQLAGLASKNPNGLTVFKGET